MASNSTYSTSANSGISSLSTSSYSSSTNNNGTNWASSNATLRSCLAPLNQNTHPLGARRHSTLDQSGANSSRGASSASARSLLNTSRVAEARRMAAANALAQSKKTSSALATKLANSAVAASKDASTSRSQDGVKSSRFPSVSSQRNQTSSSSTMHLARSLSSLSAKDLRASNSSLSRLSSHRASVCNESRKSISSNATLRGHIKERHGSTRKIVDQGKTAKITPDTSHRELFVEPIVESEDVDMSPEQQVSPNCAVGTQAIHSASSSQSRSVSHTPMVQRTNNINSHGSSLLLTGTNTGSQVNSFKRTFESIKMLALNNTGCQWRVVCSILSRMPNLEELHLSLNNYEKIDLEPNEFKHNSLKRLYLCNNPKLTNWEELDKLLIAFPSLEALSIANCNISQIPDNLDRAREWRKLCGLNINGWPIKEWPVVERLNQLPSLVDLKCRNLDVLNSIDEPRHHLIARLPKLQRLNGSEIEEREDAEKAFIRFFIANSHLERPTRFHELMQIYGEISTVDVDVDLSPPSQAQVRVIYLDRSHYRKENNDDIMMSEDFLLKLMDNADNGSNMEIVVEAGTSSNLGAISGEQPVRLFKDEGQEIVALNVDLRQSVRKFKSNLATLFGLDNQSLILYYIDHEMVGLMGPELLKHNQKKLWNYNVQNGDQFIVEEL